MSGEVNVGERLVCASARERFGAGASSLRVLASGHEGRTVFAFEQGSRRLIAKHYPDDAGRIGMDRLRAVAAIAGGRLRVPEPIDYDADRRIVWMAPASGRLLADCDPCDRDEARGGSFVRVGEALAVLHAAKLDFGPPRRLVDHVAELVRPDPGELIAAAPEIAGAVAEFDARRRVLDEQGAREAWCAPLHRDFHLRQLFDDGRGITVVDWDLAAAGDPAFDVAYLIAYLEAHLPTEDAARAKARFLSGYRPPAELLARIPVYRAFNLLRRACRRLRLKDAGWRVEMDRMLMRLRVLLETPS